MNCLRSVFAKSLPVVLLAGAFAGSQAVAFPPAPHHELYGMVRDQWGDPIVANGAVVYLQSTNGVGVRASIVASTEPGVNYRLDVPMDSGTTPDLYLTTALRRGQPFQLKIVIGNTVYLPIEMTLGAAQLGRPAESTRLDLTLGVDSDGDGLPDAWEQAIINARGGTLASITPDGDADGDGISNLAEYLAGTYAFDPTDGFRLALVAQNAGDATLEFLAVRNRTYTVQSSTDLRQWTPVQFGVVNAGTAGPLQDSYVSTDVRMLQIQVPRQTGVTNRFFKAVVQ
jgi:thrombospondin type 3 repeat protein